MNVKQWMTSDLITVQRGTGLNEAWDLMQRQQIRHLLVLEGSRLVGILSDRDIRLVLPSPATSLTSWEVTYLLNALTADRVMTPAPITIAPDRSLSDAAGLMLEHRIGALPVVDARGVCGIITQTDVLRAFRAERGGPRPATAPVEPPQAVGRPVARRILLPLDLEGRHGPVLTAGRELARRTSAVLRVLHVAPMPEAVIVDGHTVSYIDQEMARVDYETRRKLALAVAPLAGDVPVEFVVRFGNPTSEIVSEAEAAAVDLIVMASHRRTGVRRLVQGSVAEDVERAIRLPVLLVPYEGEVRADTTEISMEVDVS